MELVLITFILGFIVFPAVLIIEAYREYFKAMREK